MSKTKRGLLFVALFLFVPLLAYQGFRQYRVSHPNRTHSMNEQLNEIQTFCVGRFLIDLPKGTTIIGGNGSARGANFVARYPVTYPEFDHTVSTRWAELKERKSDVYGTPYVQPSRQVQPQPRAFIFAYEHVMLSGEDATGVVRDRLHHETEGYLWQDNVLYTFSDHPVESAVIETMQALKVRHDDQIPNEIGFCGPFSFFSGPSRSESTSIAFRLPTNPVIELRIRTTTFSAIELRPYAPRPNLRAFESDTFKSATHRDAQRTVAGSQGEELLVGTTEFKGDKYRTGILARWFYPGEPSSSAKPAIEVKFEASYETSAPPSPWGGFPPKRSPNDIGEEEFLTYWDAILKTLRLRPDALRTGDK